MVAQIDSRFWKTSPRKAYTRILSYLFYEGRPLTTKGRWINPTVFFLYRLQAHSPFAKPVKKPIFILGTGRSGTTILGVTLAMHRDVGFLNEPKALWNYLNPNDDLIGSYSRKPGRYRLGVEDASRAVCTRAHRILGHYLRFSLSTRVVDKYPELIFRVPYVQKIFPDAKFLFLYRNGLDTCHSISSWSNRMGQESKGEVHDWWGLNDRKWNYLCDQVVAKDETLGSKVNNIRLYQEHSYRAAVEWIVSMKQGLKLVADSRYPVMALRYESYVEDADYRNQVLDFCELTSDPNFDSYAANVLNKVKSYPPISFPSEIASEFHSVMRALKYEA